MHIILYAHHRSRKKSDLKSGTPLSYVNKSAEPGIIDIVNEKKNKILAYVQLFRKF